MRVIGLLLVHFHSSESPPSPLPHGERLPDLHLLMSSLATQRRVDWLIASSAPMGPDGAMLVSDQLYQRVAGIETAIRQSIGGPTHLQNFNRDSKLNAAIDESVYVSALIFIFESGGGHMSPTFASSSHPHMRRML